MSLELLAQIAIFCVSLFALVKASDWFVSASENIGLSLGISPFIIGVTIVAFGTSLPELASSVAAVLGGESEIVVGNVVGSNITNILLVLGLTVVFGREIKLKFNVMVVDMPLLVASAFFLWFALSDGKMALIECIMFLVALVIFLLNSVLSKKEDEKENRSKISLKDVLMLIGGGVVVYLGATFTITSIQQISEMLSFPPAIIAVTAVALGTSLPEVAVSITAAKKGNPGIAVGNVLGSNIFNTYAVMAIPSLIGPLEIPSEMMSFHIPFMIAVTILFAMVCMGGKITRWEGSMLALLYVYFIYESIKFGII